MAQEGDRVTARLPDGAQRWRCAGCGNLTRFDVTRTRRTTEYWHFALSGDHKVEESQLLNETVESVTCRWCGRADAIELIDRNDAAHSEDPAAD
jgi:RNase P subunit RPR2